MSVNIITCNLVNITLAFLQHRQHARYNNLENVTLYVPQKCKVIFVESINSILPVFDLMKVILSLHICISDAHCRSQVYFSGLCKYYIHAFFQLHLSCIFSEYRYHIKFFRNCISHEHFCECNTVHGCSQIPLISCQLLIFIVTVPMIT